jgi:hypothetical protein
MASKVKVNTVETESGSTLTLGKSGDTVTLASGASQSGFGRTGTVDWQTTPKTSSFTAANGEGYFINTTSSAITMTMPSGSAGAIVSIQDYNKTFDTNALSIAPASGEKINGGEAGGTLSVATEGQGLTFVYVDSTVGWKTVHENEFTSGGSNFIIASGGTETTCGDFKIHTFTGPGTFTVSNASATPSHNIVSYMVLAGGGGGSGHRGGGAGAGGYRENKSPVDTYTASPLEGSTDVTISAQSYPITVGGGGTGADYPSVRDGTDGSDSVFSTITSAGGGKGGGTSCRAGGTGGSGGGHVGDQSSPGTGAAGNTPPVSPAQGTPGGNPAGAPTGNDKAGGGGGASTKGANATDPAAGPGGNGTPTSITGSAVTRAGGGGGGARSGPGGNTAGSGGPGGGGAGGNDGNAGSNATVNGSGGGGGGSNADGGNGSGGLVVIRYKFQ